MGDNCFLVKNEAGKAGAGRLFFIKNSGSESLVGYLKFRKSSFQNNGFQKNRPMFVMGRLFQSP